MNSLDRVTTALNHREPDHVPLDIGGTGVSQMHERTYRNLRAYLGLSPREPEIILFQERLPRIDDELADLLETDVVFVMPQPGTGYEVVVEDLGEYLAFTDEWGIGWRMPKQGGFYFDMYHHPLATAETLSDFREFPLPDPLDDRRYENIRSEVETALARGKAVVLNAPGAGILEMYSWLRGYEDFYVDLALNHDFVAYMLDRNAELKMAYWERVLADVGDLVTVCAEYDDLAGQNAMLFSPETYRTLVKPRHKRLIQFIKERTDAKVFYHTDGAVRSVIPDLIDAGIDILNPVQFTAADMELRSLKAEFGADLTFWGGGVNTQGVLDVGTPAEVREDVKRNIEALAPGGGFVFATVHDIQANVPPENVMAMWETWREFGWY